MLNRTTINARIKRGMTREEAENTPILIDRKLKLSLEKVIEVEAHGLSINNSALILKVAPGTLHAFIKRKNITWRGKKPNFKVGEKNQTSQLQKTKVLGIKNMTVFKRMERGMSYDEAIKKPVRKYNKKTKERVCNHE